MEKDKKTSRSFDLSKRESRSFDLKKRSTRTFDLKKDDEVSIHAAETTLKSQTGSSEPIRPTSQSATQPVSSHGMDPTPSTATTPADNNGGGNKKKWVWSILVVIVLVVLALLLIPRGQSENAQDEAKQKENVDSVGSNVGSATPADSTKKDSTETISSEVSSTTASPTEKSSATPQQQGNATPTHNSSTSNIPASTVGSIEEQAQQVIRGVYGNNPERRHKLGSDYKIIQKRVNELMRK